MRTFKQVERWAKSIGVIVDRRRTSCGLYESWRKDDHSTVGIASTIPELISDVQIFAEKEVAPVKSTAKVTSMNELQRLLLTPVQLGQMMIESPTFREALINLRDQINPCLTVR